MKKITTITILLLSIFTITACTPNVTLNLEKTKININNLTTKNFDIYRVEQLLNNDESLNLMELEGIYEEDLKNETGLNTLELENYLVKINQSTKDMYLILKPQEGKKNNIIKQMNAYYKSLEENPAIKDKIQNRLEKEHKGYLIYIVSNDNNKAFDIIKSSNELVFSNMVEIRDNELKTLTNIDVNDLEEYIVEIPMIAVKANTYFILKPKEGKEDKIKKQMDEYMKNLEQQWEMYLQDQYQLVQNRLETKYGKYLIYIVSNDNDSVVKAIKDSRQ